MFVKKNYKIILGFFAVVLLLFGIFYLERILNNKENFQEAFDRENKNKLFEYGSGEVDKKQEHQNGRHDSKNFDACHWLMFNEWYDPKQKPSDDNYSLFDAEIVNMNKQIIGNPYKTKGPVLMKCNLKQSYLDRYNNPKDKIMKDVVKEKIKNYINNKDGRKNYVFVADSNKNGLFSETNQQQGTNSLAKYRQF
jgi:hypothetical protein